MLERTRNCGRLRVSMLRLTQSDRLTRHAFRPILLDNDAEPQACLVIGLNPRRPWDEQVRALVDA